MDYKKKRVSIELREMLEQNYIYIYIHRTLYKSN